MDKQTTPGEAPGKDDDKPWWNVVEWFCGNKAGSSGNLPVIVGLDYVTGSDDPAVVLFDGQFIAKQHQPIK